MPGRVGSPALYRLCVDGRDFALPDSHKSETFDAFEHGHESDMTVDQHDWSGLAVIAVPPAQPRANPRCVREGAGWIWVALTLSAAFEGLADRLADRLIGRVGH